jgi:hypothetical protein
MNMHELAYQLALNAIVVVHSALKRILWEEDGNSSYDLSECLTFSATFISGQLSAVRSSFHSARGSSVKATLN